MRSYYICITILLIIVILVFLFWNSGRIKTQVAQTAKISNLDDDYYIIQGVVPDIIPTDVDAKFTFDHVGDLMSEGKDEFVWMTASIWGGYVYPKGTIKADTKFIRAPTATTYIKKSDLNTFLKQPDISYTFLGFTKS